MTPIACYLLLVPSALAAVVQPGALSGSGGRISLSKKSSEAKLASKKTGVVDKNILKEYLHRHQVRAHAS